MKQPNDEAAALNTDDEYSHLERLTAKEKKMLQALADSYGDFYQVMEMQKVSKSTMKIHFHHIYTKLGVTNKVGALIEGLKQNLIQVEGINYFK